MHIIFLISTHSQHLKHRRDVPDCLTWASSLQFQLRPKSTTSNSTKWVDVAKGTIWVKKPNAKAGEDLRRAWAAWTLPRQGSPGMPRLCLGSFNSINLPWVLAMVGWCCSCGTTEGKNRQLKYSLLTNPLIPSYFKGKILPKACRSPLYLVHICRNVQRLFRTLPNHGFSDNIYYAVSPRAEGELCWACSFMLCSSQPCVCPTGSDIEHGSSKSQVPVHRLPIFPPAARVHWCVQHMQSKQQHFPCPELS